MSSALAAAPPVSISKNSSKSEIELAKKKVVVGRFSVRIPISFGVWTAYKASVFAKSTAAPASSSDNSPAGPASPLVKAAAALALAAEALAEAAGASVAVPSISSEKKVLEPPIFKAIESGLIEIISFPTASGLLESVEADPAFLCPNFTTPLAPSCFFGTLVRDRKVANEVNLLPGRSWGGRFSEKMNRGTRCGLDKVKIPSVRRVVTGGASVVFEEDYLYRADFPMGTIENTRRFWFSSFCAVFKPTGVLENANDDDLPFTKKDKDDLKDEEDESEKKFTPATPGEMILYLPVVRFGEEEEFKRVEDVLREMNLSFIGGNF